MIFPIKGYRYDRVVDPEGPSRRPRARAWWRIHLIYGAIAAGVAITFFYIGQDLAQSRRESVVQRVLQLETAPYTFQQNYTFSQAPSKQVDKVWKNLLPKKGGFFDHPIIAPERSALAVFHQIHCLDEIRQGLYAMRDGLMANESGDNPNHDHGKSLSHINHCIDLIRQSLMCQPDLTVEVVDKELAGVSGFGTEHQCVDWNQLLDWMKIHEG